MQVAERSDLSSRTLTAALSARHIRNEKTVPIGTVLSGKFYF